MLYSILFCFTYVLLCSIFVLEFKPTTMKTKVKRIFYDYTCIECGRIGKTTDRHKGTIEKLCYGCEEKKHPENFIYL